MHVRMGEGQLRSMQGIKHRRKSDDQSTDAPEVKHASSTAPLHSGINYPCHGRERNKGAIRGKVSRPGFSEPSLPFSEKEGKGAAYPSFPLIHHPLHIESPLGSQPFLAELKRSSRQAHKCGIYSNRPCI
jgi:hypothetical protein